ncbi:MAG: hypothetical protein ACYC0V_00180 [Armatimonadota bacterium]
MDDRTYDTISQQCVSTKEKLSQIETRLSTHDTKLAECDETKTAVTKLIENLISVNKKLASICRIGSWADMAVGALLIAALTKTNIEVEVEMKPDLLDKTFKTINTSADKIIKWDWIALGILAPTACIVLLLAVAAAPYITL